MCKPRVTKKIDITHYMFFCVRKQFFDQVKYLGVWLNASLKDDGDDI